jgi:hypothetical protein
MAGGPDVPPHDPGASRHTSGDNGRHPSAGDPRGRDPRPGHREPGGRGPAGNPPGGYRPGGNQPGGNQPGGYGSGGYGSGGYGREQGNGAGRGRDPVAGAPTRKLPAQPDMAPGVRNVADARKTTGGNPRRKKPEGQPGPGGLGRWGSLQGGLGVFIIVCSTAIGAIATMVTGSAPGFLLGVFVIIGTVAAALAVRPRAGRTILPAPVLCYLVAALLAGVIYDHSTGSSQTALAIGAAQWVASGFVAMATATVLAIVLITVRWCLWHRHQPSRKDPDWPPPPAAVRRHPASREALTDPRYPASDPGRPGPGPDRRRPGPYSGSGPYNFSSGA